MEEEEKLADPPKSRINRKGTPSPDLNGSDIKSSIQKYTIYVE